MANYTTNYNLTKPTSSETASIQPINSNMDTIDDIMHGSQVSAADAYDTTATYAIGDLVMYGYELYRCIAAVTVAEAFDANKWVRTTLAQEIIRAVTSLIAPAYDNTATYAVGDYTVHGGLLYKCTTAVSTAEDFDSSKWTATTVMQEV